MWNASTQKCSCLAHEHGLLAVISGCTCQGVPNNPCSGDKPVFIDGQCYALCDTPGQDIYSFCGDCGTKTDKCLQRPNDSHPEAGYLVPGTCQVLGGSSGFEFEGGTLLEGEKQKLTDGLSVKP
ncbi:MAG: hypothetical protein LBR90_05095 [Elusimicrobiota bacterium]|nr:hypothetical protein [Elusimicrobiota bacterium]